MIFLSVFEINELVPQHKLYDNAIADLVNLCKRNELPYFCSNKFSSYQFIENRLNESDVIIALIDKYWTSSTWKLHEVTWPLEEYSSMSGVRLVQKNRIVILYWLEDTTCYPLKNIKKSTHSVYNMLELKDTLEQFYKITLR